jgi:hypothetical protein
VRLIQSKLQHGTESIQKFIELTMDEEAQVDIRFAYDVIEIGKELGAATIIDRANKSLTAFLVEKQNFGRSDALYGWKVFQSQK